MRTLHAIVFSIFAASAKAQASPLGKVVKLMTSLEANIVAEGKEADKTLKEFTSWCDLRTKNLAEEIDEAQSQIQNLKATIEEQTSRTTELRVKIEDVSSSISSDEGDLKAAADIRKSEEKDFLKAQSDLEEVIGALGRAIEILETKSQSNPSMMQVQKANNVAQALKLMVEASMLRSDDAATLMALVQNTHKAHANEGDDDLGSQEPAVYTSKSGSIVEMLEGLLDKAKEQLSVAVKKEMTSKHNFEMLKVSLDQEIEIGNQDLGKVKKELAAATEAKATASGDLGVTTKTMAGDKEAFSNLKADCESKFDDYKTASASRSEELKALAEAKDILEGASKKAAFVAYSTKPISFWQGSSEIRTSVDLANFEAVRLIRSLAQKEHDPALMQLANRIAQVISYGEVAGTDPFAKVKTMIKEVIAQLEASSKADIAHKAYCDKELGDSVEKKSQREAEIEKLTTDIDSMKSRSSSLKGEVTSLQKALSDLAAAQSESLKIRTAEKAQFEKNKPEMEEGLEAVKRALSVLREYYTSSDEGESDKSGDDKGSAPGKTIITMLQMIERDMAKALAEMTATEDTAQAAFDKETKEAVIEKSTKEGDIKHKTKEFKGLDAAIAEMVSDRAGAKSELESIMKYKGDLVKMCVTTPESYAERAERREAEIAGLKEALSVLEGETVLLQGASMWKKKRGLKRNVLSRK